MSREEKGPGVEQRALLWEEHFPLVFSPFPLFQLEHEETECPSLHFSRENLWFFELLHEFWLDPEDPDSQGKPTGFQLEDG